MAYIEGITSDTAIDRVTELSRICIDTANKVELAYQNWEKFKAGRTYAQIAAAINDLSSNRELVLDADIVEGIDDCYRHMHELYEFCAGIGTPDQYDRIDNTWGDFSI